MHPESVRLFETFLESYVKFALEQKGGKSVLDVGSYDVNGNFRPNLEGKGFLYLGLDILEGPNVDLVPEDHYHWKEIENESFDLVVSGSAFEHIEFPWKTIEEIARVLKPGGWTCIIAPSAGPVHRHPVDCYRFHEDGMRALAKWADLEVVEITTSQNLWQDVCLIAKK